MSSNYSEGTRVYVGGLSESIKKEDLEKEFDKYGKLTSVWVAFNPPGFAFIEFENLDEAEHACDSLNGSEILGSKLRVEISRRRNNRGGGRGGGGFRGSRGGTGGGFRGGFREGGGGGGGGGFRGSYEGGRGAGGGGFRGRGGGRGRGSFERDSYSGGGGRGGGSYGGGGRESSYGGGGGARGGEVYGSRDAYNGSSGGYNGGSRFRSRSPVGRGRLGLRTSECILAHGNSTNQKATADLGEVTRGPRATTGISQLYLPPLRILQSYKSDGASKLRYEMISSKQPSPPLQKRR